jgi:hypothetical protein
MVTTRGKSDVQRFMAGLPEQIVSKLLVGAGRAGGKVIADEAKERTTSQDVADNIVVRTKRDGDRIIVRITVKKGFALSVGNWLEWGTSAHFISVDASQRGGKSVRRINELGDHQSLMINGKFVGETVYHPGARPHPFLRPALDLKEGEAISMAQSYINARITPAGIVGTADQGDGDA